MLCSFRLSEFCFLSVNNAPTSFSYFEFITNRMKKASVSSRKLQINLGFRRENHFKTSFPRLDGSTLHTRDSFPVHNAIECWKCWTWSAGSEVPSYTLNFRIVNRRHGSAFSISSENGEFLKHLVLVGFSSALSIRALTSLSAGPRRGALLRGGMSAFTFFARALIFPSFCGRELEVQLPSSPVSVLT